MKRSSKSWLNLVVLAAALLTGVLVGCDGGDDLPVPDPGDLPLTPETVPDTPTSPDV